MAAGPCADGAGAARFCVALAIGLCTGIAVTLVFERIFLVRLP